MKRLAALATIAAIANCAAPPRLDLSQVAGIEQVELTPSARALLEKNGFVVLGGAGRHIGAFYWAHQPLPKFITVDVVVEVLLLEMELGLVALEEHQADRLREAHALLWKAARAMEVPDPARPALRRVLALLAVGRRLLDPHWMLPDDFPDRDVVDAELAKALRAQGQEPSLLWRRPLDWTAFKPVGPYAATEPLQRYHRFSRWWGAAGLQADDPEERICAAILAGLVVRTSEAAAILQEVESVYDLLLGGTDDVPARALVPARVDGLELPRDLGSDALDAWIRRAFAKAATPRLAKSGDRVAGPSFRLLPPRLTLESTIQSQLTFPGRWLPRGLDTLAARGNRRARDLVVAQEPTAEARTHLDRLLAKGVDALDLPDDHLQRRFWELCDAMSRLPSGDRIPAFMKSEAWQDRGLAAALATWAGARELYSPRVHEVFERKGVSKYVPPIIEPNLEAWRRLVDLCRAAVDLFRRAGMKWESDALLFAGRFERLAERQLRGERVVEEDMIFGDRHFDALLLLLLENEFREGWPGPTADRRVCVSFAKTTDASGSRIETARWAGKACCPIFVVGEFEGRPQLYLGGVLDYREFDLPAERALTRADFRALMDSKEAPPAPGWTRSYRTVE